MGFEMFFLIVGVILIVIRLNHFFLISNFFIIGCFVIWFILFYFSKHKKNKESRTPKPVYFSN